MFRLASRKSFIFILAGLVVAFLLFSWQLIPRLLQDQAEKYIARSSAHHLSMHRHELNPFNGRLRLSGLRLTEPDSKTLRSLTKLVIDLSAK